jgi:hypothetical protein
MRREMTQINKIRNEKGEVKTNTKEIQGLGRTTLKSYIQTNWEI